MTTLTSDDESHYHLPVATNFSTIFLIAHFQGFPFRRKNPLFFSQPPNVQALAFCLFPKKEKKSEGLVGNSKFSGNLQLQNGFPGKHQLVLGLWWLDWRHTCTRWKLHCFWFWIQLAGTGLEWVVECQVITAKIICNCFFLWIQCHLALHHWWMIRFWLKFNFGYICVYYSSLLCFI